MFNGTMSPWSADKLKKELANFDKMISNHQDPENAFCFSPERLSEAFVRKNNLVRMLALPEDEIPQKEAIAGIRREVEMKSQGEIKPLKLA